MGRTVTRAVLRRVHRWIGLALALPLILQALTGLVLAAEQRIHVDAAGVLIDLQLALEDRSFDGVAADVEQISVTAENFPVAEYDYAAAFACPTVEQIDVDEDGAVRLGQQASILRDKRIPLELCPSSNVQTGAVKSIADHPFDLLARARFRVTVNTDNRLMSDTTMSLEMHRLVEAFGYGWSDLERFTINAMKSAFIPFDERLALIDGVIKPRYAVLIG